MPPPDFERGAPRSDETPLLKSPVFWIVVAVVLGLGGALYLWDHRRQPQEQADAQGQIREAPAPVGAASEPAVAPNAEPTVQYPVPQAPSTPGAEPKPLPPLDESDEAVQQSLTGAFGKRSFAGVPLSEELIRHLVATVDGLPRQHVATHLFPLRPPPGRLATSGKGEVVVLSPDNFARYDRYVRLAQALDTKQLVAIYVRFYPLFQQAYIELGYPNRYFNDRLVEVIDHLVASPEVQGPVELVRFGPLFELQDPDLEALSAGRKLLVRMGPANAAVIRSKLRELRREIAASAPT
jgi:Protein of unknown function (DUF3014)